MTVSWQDDPSGADTLLAEWPDVEDDPDELTRLRARVEALLPKLWWDRLHPVVFKAGNSLTNQGLQAEALAFWERLLPTAVERLGEEHPDALTIRNNLYWAAGRSGDPGRALDGFRELLEVRRRVLGDDDQNTLATRHALAVWRDECGDHDGAVATLRALVTDYERVLGDDHRDTLNTRIALVEILGGQDPGAAVRELRVLVEDFRRVRGTDDPEVFEVEVELAAWLSEAGETEEALERIDRVLGDYRRVLGAEHHDTLALRYFRATLLADGGREAMQELLDETVGLLDRGRREVADVRESAEAWLAQA